MYYHSVQFLSVVGMLLQGVASDSIEANIYITVEDTTLGVVKGYDVGIVIMVEVLTVNLQYFIVVAEYVTEFAYLATIARCHSP